jgi:hypothetical protein
MSERQTATPNPMGLDHAGIAADISKLTAAGFSDTEALAMANGRARQQRDLRAIRGELPPIETIDGDAQEAERLNREAFAVAPDEKHSFDLRPVGAAPEEVAAAQYATEVARDAARAMGLTDGVARELVQILQAGLSTADTAGEAATTEARAKAKAALRARYGDETDALLRDAKALRRRAGPDAATWLETSMKCAGSFDHWWVVSTLSRHHRATQAG